MAGANSKQTSPPSSKKPTSLTKAEGQEFIIQYFEEAWDIRNLDYQTILGMMNNPYANKVETNLTNLIFQDPYILNVIDVRTEQPNEEVAKWMRHMCEGFGLWDQMQICFKAWLWWGDYIISKGLDRIDNKIQISEIRDLPPETFVQGGAASQDIITQGTLLKGIMLLKDEKIHFFQLTKGSELQELKNCEHYRSPVYKARYKIDGVPIMNPLFQLFNRANFSWKSLMQANNRAGAPSMFMSVSNPIKNLTDRKR